MNNSKDIFEFNKIFNTLSIDTIKKLKKYTEICIEETHYRKLNNIPNTINKFMHCPSEHFYFSSIVEHNNLDVFMPKFNNLPNSILSLNLDQYFYYKVNNLSNNIKYLYLGLHCAKINELSYNILYIEYPNNSNNKYKKFISNKTIICKLDCNKKHIMN